jgi:transposase, IS5 family
MTAKAIKSKRKPASRSQYVSPNQLILSGFETPFEQQLTTNNRWVKLSNLIPWDRIVSKYNIQFKSKEGRPPVSGRIIIGAVIIKHMLNLTDEETINQIEENMFMQYFLGYSSFTNEAPFDSSLFVDIRSRLTPTILDEISYIIALHHQDKLNIKITDPDEEKEEKDNDNDRPAGNDVSALPNQGRLIMDATVCPQAITFPTDIKVIGSARKKSEELIDKLYAQTKHLVEKPRTYRELARNNYLNGAKKKSISNKDKYNVIDQQLRFLNRNNESIKKLQNVCVENAIDSKLSDIDRNYIKTLSTVYDQQAQMHRTGDKSIEHRIVNIHQPHVRPIVRGKAGKKTEFGSKIQMPAVLSLCKSQKMKGCSIPIPIGTDFEQV